MVGESGQIGHEKLRSERCVMNIKRLFLLVMGVSIALSSGIYAQMEKVAVEDYYRSRAQRALDAVYGPNNFIVDVNVTMTTPRYTVRYTEEANPKLNNANQADKKVNILPGYPVIRNLGTGDLNKMPFNSVTTLTNVRIQRINITLLVNKSFPKGQAGRAKSMLEAMLELGPRDSIKMTFQKFAELDDGEPQEIVIKSTTPPIVSVQNIISFLMLLTLIVFVVLFALFQRKAAAAQGEGGKKGDADAPNISINPNIELPESGSGGSGDELNLKQAPDIKRYFDFIDMSNVDALTYILKKEKVSVENIAIIVAFLRPNVASKVIGSLELQQQAMISTFLLSERKINRQMIDKLESNIKDTLECMAGGKETFQGVFQYVSGEMKKKILTILSKSNPTGYKLFRSNIVIFDDLKFLSDDELKLLLSDANVEMLSKALISVDPNTYQKIDQNLTSSAKAMIKQFLDLKGKQVSKHDTEKAQDYIIGLALKFEQEGKIDLRGKIKV